MDAVSTALEFQDPAAECRDIGLAVGDGLAERASMKDGAGKHREPSDASAVGNALGSSR